MLWERFRISWMPRIILFLVLLLAPLSTAAQEDKGFKDPVGLGLDFTPEEKYLTIEKSSVFFKGAVPPSYDLSGKMPPVGNQGLQSSCVAWSTGYYVRSYMAAKQYQWLPRDNTKIFSPAYIYNQIRRGECQRGLTMPSALDLMAGQGILPLAEFPYSSENCFSIPNPDQMQRAAQYRIQRWSRVDFSNLEEVKKQLVVGNPVIVGCKIDQNFKRFRGSQPFSDFNPNQVSGGHAMVVVGYDDAKQALRLINSWGNRWGDNGFAWVSFQTFLQMCREAYVIEEPMAPGPVPGPPVAVATTTTTTTLPPAPPVTRPPEPENVWAREWAKLETLADNASYRVLVSANKTHFQVGDTLEITCQVPKAGYLNILALAPGAYRATVIYPNKFHPENQVEQGQVINIPAPGDGFILRAHPPAGKSLIVVFHTENKINAYNEGLGAEKGAFKTLSPKSLQDFTVEKDQKLGPFGAGKIITQVSE